MPWREIAFLLICMFDEAKPIKSIIEEMIINLGFLCLTISQNNSIKGIIKIYQQQRIERPIQYIRKRINSITRVKSRSF